MNSEPTNLTLYPESTNIYMHLQHTNTITNQAKGDVKNKTICYTIHYHSTEILKQEQQLSSIQYIIIR